MNKIFKNIIKKMQKVIYNQIKANKVFSRYIPNKFFSTLIVPEISNGKIHSSSLNITTAASQLDKDVNTIFHSIILKDSYFSLWI